MSDIRDLIRSCISPFIQGPELSALLDAIGDQAEYAQDFSVKAGNQMNISTASSQYLKQRASEIGIVVPDDVGISDYVLRKLAINVTATKQVTAIVNDVLETFYGTDAVRAYAQTVNPEPYQLVDGMQLLWQADGQTFKYEAREEDYPPGHLAQATADEVASAITKYLRTIGAQGFAQAETDPDTTLNYVKLYAGAKGTTSKLQITGGEVQRVLNFPTLIEYPDPLPSLWPVYYVVQDGSKIRFVWAGNSDPRFDLLHEGDIALIYGTAFQSDPPFHGDLTGSFVITRVQSGGVAASPGDETAAFFEIENPTASVNAVSPSVSQGTYDALRFYRPMINRPQTRSRYALSWEAGTQTLKLYLPATTTATSKNLIGAAHLSSRFSSTSFESQYGSMTQDAGRLSVLNAYAFSFADPQDDLTASLGQLTADWPAYVSANDTFKDDIVTASGIYYRAKQSSPTVGPPSSTYWDPIDSVAIDYISREAKVTTVVCKEPHGLNTLDSDTYPTFSTANSYTVGDITDFEGSLFEALQSMTTPSPYPTNAAYWSLVADDTLLSNRIVTITDIPAVGGTETFLGPYTYQTGKNSLNGHTDGAAPAVASDGKYSLTTKTAILAQNVLAGGSYKAISMGSLSTGIDATGFLMFDLNSDNEEGPVPYVDVLPGGVVLSPSFKFEKSHAIGGRVDFSSADVAIVSDDGTDYPPYITATAPARNYCASLIEQITALGIALDIVIVYPSSLGLGGGNYPTDGSVPQLNDNIWIFSNGETLDFANGSSDKVLNGYPYWS